MPLISSVKKRANILSFNTLENTFLTKSSLKNIVHVTLHKALTPKPNGDFSVFIFTSNIQYEL